MLVATRAGASSQDNSTGASDRWSGNVSWSADPSFGVCGVQLCPGEEGGSRIATPRLPPIDPQRGVSYCLALESS